MTTESLGAPALDVAALPPPNWQARWLHHPAFPFGGTPPTPPPENLHFLFRHEFALPPPPVRRARLFLTADDLYKVWVDGEFVGAGPAPIPPEGQPYNGYDVTHLLTARGPRHCLAAHVYYCGHNTGAHASGDLRHGLWLQLEIEFDGAPPLTLASDDTWRVTHSQARQHGGRYYGYKTQLAEDLDLRRWEAGWERPGFDASGWRSAAASPLPPDYTLAPQVALPVVYTRRSPERVVKKGPGHYFLDFGAELVGETCLRASGPAGHVLEVRHGEELSGPDEVRFAMRCNCTYQERVTLAGRGPDEAEFFAYKGFRYLELLNWPGELAPGSVWVKERHTPFPAAPSTFRAADPVLTDIWGLCAQAVRVGTQELFLDCPTREKAEYLGDGLVTGLAHLTLTADPRVFAQFLDDFALNAARNPLVSDVGTQPGSKVLAEYSLLLPTIVADYYRHTGDRRRLEQWLPLIENMLAHFGQYVGRSGLLEDLHRVPGREIMPLVDWPPPARDGYDDPSLLGLKPGPDDDGIVNTVVNAHFYLALQTYAQLLEACERHHQAVHQARRAAMAARQLRLLLRRPSDGLYLDRLGSEHASLHASVVPFFAGLVPAHERRPVLRLIREKRLACGVWFAYFVLRALYRHGEGELAFELLNGRDEHCWHRMLATGGTACMEAWDPEQKWNTSLCHPWASAPIPCLAGELMGLQPARPGWEAVLLRPQLPRALPTAELRLNTPRGVFTASYEWAGPELIYRLELPRALPLQVRLPGAAHEVLVDGRSEPGRDVEWDGAQPLVGLDLQLPAGQHEFRWTRRA